MAYKLRESKLKILLLGYIVRGPLAGMTWHHIQYLIGLNDLGHDVYFYEDSGDSHYCCYNPQTGNNNEDPTYGLDYFKNLFLRLELNNIWCYHDNHQNNYFGNFRKNFLDEFSDFDILINLSASNPIREWMLKIPNRVLIDTDPVFTQIRNIQNTARKDLTTKHNVHFTFGENINLPNCKIPDDGFNWRATRQPIVLRLWQNSTMAHNQKFTSILQWKSYNSMQYEGVKYGVKSESFHPYMGLPKDTDQNLELALGGPDAPRVELRKNNWEITNPLDISSDPWNYMEYINNSKAEFSVAKEAYVKSYSGWFSERSACYLASGRPVLTQDTGFTEIIETGSGLLSFGSPIEALFGIDEINSNYRKHCKKAKEIAREHFNAKSILKSLIEYSMEQLDSFYDQR